MRRGNPYGIHGRYGGRGRQGQQNNNMYLLMLLGQLFHQIAQLEYKPPVTLVLMAVNIGLYMDPSMLPFAQPIQDCCLNPSQILSPSSDALSALSRLLLSGFLHGSDMHLYYNMASLLWKGVHLERQLGSEGFLKLCATMLVLSHSLVVVVAKLLLELGYPDSYSMCAVGFSAVLFALKYVLNFHSPGRSNIFGIAVPTKHAAWLELVVIQITVPNASFLGHLCGILSGLIYIHVILGRSINDQFTSRTEFENASAGATRQEQRNSSEPSYTYARGTAHGHTGLAANQPADNQYEQDLQEAIRRSRQTERTTTRNNNEGQQRPDNAEDMRRRRLERFGN